MLTIEGKFSIFERVTQVAFICLPEYVSIMDDDIMKIEVLFAYARDEEKPWKVQASQRPDEEIEIVKDAMEQYGMVPEMSRSDELIIGTELFSASQENMKLIDDFENELTRRYGKTNVSRGSYDPDTANMGLEGSSKGVTVTSFSIEDLPTELNSS